MLEVLERNGLLRRDPLPPENPSDPLESPAEVIRFSFQRFQDHLMAESLLESVSNIERALGSREHLSFIHDGTCSSSKWQGLIEALSIQIPEKFGRELIAILPGQKAIGIAIGDLQRLSLKACAGVREMPSPRQRLSYLRASIVGMWICLGFWLKSQLLGIIRGMRSSYTKILFACRCQSVMLPGLCGSTGRVKKQMAQFGELSTGVDMLTGCA